jgi:cytochrome c5
MSPRPAPSLAWLQAPPTIRRCIALVLVAWVLGGCGEQPPGEATHPGEAVYNRSCFSCHAAGVANAPRPGDAEAWAPRLAKGRELLLESVRRGMPPGMPPGGLCTGCSDEELAAALDYMLTRTR